MFGRPYSAGTATIRRGWPKWRRFSQKTSPTIALLGLDWPWVTDPDTLDAIMQVVGGVAAAMAWRERVNPRRRLVVG